MDMLVNPRSPIDYGNVNEEMIKDFALNAEKSGIIFLGGCVGSGKSSTTESFLQHLVKHNIFKTESTIHINTFKLKDDNYRHVASGAYDAATDLIKGSVYCRLFVVIDEINSIDSLNAAIALADAGHSVLCLVQTPYRAGLGAVLASTLAYVEADKRAEFAKKLIEHTNLFIEQPSHCSQVDWKPEYRYISCPTGFQELLVSGLNEHGLDYVYKEILDASVDYQGY